MGEGGGGEAVIRGRHSHQWAAGAREKKQRKRLSLHRTPTYPSSNCAPTATAAHSPPSPVRGNQPTRHRSCFRRSSCRCPRGCRCRHRRRCRHYLTRPSVRAHGAGVAGTATALPLPPTPPLPRRSKAPNPTRCGGAATVTSAETITIWEGRALEKDVGRDGDDGTDGGQPAWAAPRRPSPKAPSVSDRGH